MQQRFGGDERFRLDERFAVEEEDSDNGFTVENGNEGADMKEEKKRNMDILESILGKPMFNDDAGKKRKEYGFVYNVIDQLILLDLLFFFQISRIGEKKEFSGSFNFVSIIFVSILEGFRLYFLKVKCGGSCVALASNSI